jgi:beta-lactamase regulating signal transducer with metallopeptidase domain
MLRLEAILLDAGSIFYIINLAITVSLVCGAGLWAGRVCRRGSAPLRHGILAATLLLILVSPAAVWLAQRSGLALVRVALSGPSVASQATTRDGAAIRVSSPAGAPSPVTATSKEVPPFMPIEQSIAAGTDSASAPPDTLVSGTTPVSASEARSASVRFGGRNATAATQEDRDRPAWWQLAGSVAAWLWMLGSAIGLLRLGWACVGLARFCRRLAPLYEPRQNLLVHRAADAVGLRKLPAVFLSHLTGVPVSIGLLRPAIVLPESMLPEAEEEQLQAVLLHEMAHIARRDHWVGIGQRIASALFWWNPLVYRTCAEISDLREEICDDQVVLVQGEGWHLARLLVDLAARAARRPQLPAAVGVLEPKLAGLTARVRRLVDEERRMDLRMNLRSRVLVLVCGLAVLIGMASVGGLRLAGAQAGTEKRPAGADQPGATLQAGPAGAKVSTATKPRHESAASSAAATAQDEGLTYRGQVVDKTTGRPVAGATVLVRVSVYWSSENRILEEAKHETDAEGNYSFHLSPQQVNTSHLYLEFEVSHPKYAHRSAEGYALSMIRKNDKLGGRPFFARLPVQPAAEISGTVVTPDGRPAAGVHVKVYSKAKKDDISEYGSFDKTTTDASGVFRINVVKGGEAVLWLLPNAYSPSTHLYHQPQGDLGRFTLEKGETLQGRVVTLEGKPVSKVWVNAELRSGPAKKEIGMPVFDSLARVALTDSDGRFTMKPLPVGEYTLIISDYARGGDVEDRTRYPVPDVFLQQHLSLEASGTPHTVEIRAVPHICITMQQVDSKGKPKKTHAVHFAGHMGDQWFWTDGRPDANGKIAMKVPKGIDSQEIGIMTNEHGSARWRFGKTGDLNNSREIKLGRLDRDMDFTIYYYDAPLLLVKVAAENGAMIPDAKLQIVFPNLKKPYDEVPRWIDGGQGDLRFEKQADGRWRSEQLLPDEPFLLVVEAKGYKPWCDRLSLPEGASKDLVVRLEKN